MQNSANQKQTGAPGKCIGCRDCTGLCKEIVELAFLPDAILKHGK